MKSLKIGLLPLYLKLYDEFFPERRAECERFAESVREEFKRRGAEVSLAGACRVAEEFKAAVSAFEKENLDAIVTLHLAYSPSLEAIEALAGAKLPLVVLDTTPDWSFGPAELAAGLLMRNHGIHGVQDLCNLLLRHGKKFTIEAGHWRNSDVMNRAMSAICGLHAAKAMRSARVGLIGEPFRGMGDFSVPFSLLKEKLGVETVQASPEAVAKMMPAMDSAEVKAEIESDFRLFSKGKYSHEALALSEAAGLAVRRWLEEERLDAFTMNFLDIKGHPGLPAVPFLEASKAMARGLGYAGEGDVLTAALCGALMQAFPETSFTEMFCPDWEGGRIYMSHMGEMNVSLMKGRPVLAQKPFAFTPANDPVIAAGLFKAGAARLVNLAPGPGFQFTLIAAEAEVCETQEKLENGVGGWIKPLMPAHEFLEAYSRLGGTHHLALCYGTEPKALRSFAEDMGFAYASIP